MGKRIRQQFLSARGQMFLAFLIPYLILAAWSLSAFWQHVDSLRPAYRNGARLGAMGGEAILLILIWQKCFSVHIGVRKWALICGFIFASFMLSHTAALWGINEAEIKQNELETRLKKELTEMSKEQSAAIGQNNAETSSGLSQRERLANKTKATNAQAQIMEKAQERLTREIAGREEKIKGNSIFPKWYLDGWMYGVIFIVGLLALSITGWLSMNREDIDRNYDDIPDNQETQNHGDDGLVPLALTPAQAEQLQRLLTPGKTAPGFPTTARAEDRTKN